MLPLAMPPHSLRSLGGGIFPLDEYSWQVCDTQDYSLSADGSGFTIELVAKGNVTFTGVPYPGVNISAQALVRSATRNYGLVRAGDGRFAL